MIPGQDIRHPVISEFRGGARLLRGGLIAAAVGLLGGLVGLFVDTREAAFSWLFGFAFWMGLSTAALVLLMTLHASRAKWAVVLRRAVEALSSTTVLLPLLFIPLLFVLPQLFPWVSPPKDLSPHELEMIQHKAPYLNVPFFLVRAAVFFLLWAAVAWVLERWSRRQDHDGDLRWTKRTWLLGSGALPLVALALSFAALDWLMSLEPYFFSTIYALYFFSGAFTALLAVLSLVAAWGQTGTLFNGLLRKDHFHSLGKLVFAFTAFWAYMAFSQYMLTWIADLPDEVRWYARRTEGRWSLFFLFLVFGRFLLPFFVMLSAEIKRSTRGLTAVALWSIFAHVVDVYWLVFPALHVAAPRFHWTQPFAFVGMGGAFVAFTVWRLRAGYPMPVRDPFLYESLAYHPE